MKANHQLHYRFHSWCGIVLGIMLYLLCVSGTVAVYKDELVQWCNPSLPTREPAQALSSSELFARLATNLPADDPPRRLTFPAGAYGVYELRSRDGMRVVANAKGEPVPERKVQLADFLVNLHTRIFLGHEGRWLIGVAGFGLFGSLLTGLLAHRRLLTNPLRSKSSFRQGLVSWHKLVGVGGLPAYLLFALTGIWLGLYGVIVPASGYVQRRFEDSHKSAAAIVAREPEVDLPSPPGDRSLEGLLAHTSALIPNFDPVFVDWVPPKKGEPATIAVRGNLTGSLIQRHRVGVTYDAEQGQVLSVHAPRFLGWQQRLLDSMMPLHVGDWGGQPIKLVYFLFGTLCSALCLSGLWAWADRRSRQAGWMSGLATWPRHLVIGVAGTGSLCIVLVPLLVRLGMTENLESRFLGIWAGSAISYLVITRAWQWTLAPQPLTLVRASRQPLRSLPNGVWAFLVHSLVTIGWGYMQYLTANGAKDPASQELASWWMLTGLMGLLATLMSCVYSRIGNVLHTITAFGLLILAAEGLPGAAMLIALLGISSVTWLQRKNMLSTMAQSFVVASSPSAAYAELSTDDAEANMPQSAARPLTTSEILEAARRASVLSGSEAK